MLHPTMSTTKYPISQNIILISTNHLVTLEILQSQQSNYLSPKN